MSEKSCPNTETSGLDRQSATFVLSIPPRFIPALRLLSPIQATELMKNSPLLDLWMFRLLRMRTQRTVDHHRLTVRWSTTMPPLLLKWLSSQADAVSNGCEGLPGDDSQLGEYADVKIVREQQQVNPMSACFVVCLTTSGSPLQPCDLIPNVFGLNITDERSTAVFRDLMGTFYSLKAA